MGIWEERGRLGGRDEGVVVIVVWQLMSRRFFHGLGDNRVV